MRGFEFGVQGMMMAWWSQWVVQVKAEVLRIGNCR